MKHDVNCDPKEQGTCVITCHCRCHHPLYIAAKRVVARWENGNLAEAVRLLAKTLEEFENDISRDDG